MDYARWGRRLQFPPCFLPAGMHEAYPVREKLDLEQFQSHLLLLGCSGRNQLSFEAECNEQQVATLTSGSGWIHDAAMPKAHHDHHVAATFHAQSASILLLLLWCDIRNKSGFSKILAQNIILAGICP